jgi:dihydrofolate synthase/folylpolyglutamate synthase
MYYDKIDYDVIKLSWNILNKHITLPYVIHIVGTNGKGSTGRYLASFLHQLNQKVLHYSSPHILKFNERIWIEGSDITTDRLNVIHGQLQSLLPITLLEKLTYFEYTTVMALYLSKGMDYIVLEAGLGGEFDATNVVKNDLSIFTTMGLDHQSFLGNTISEITRTKMRSCDTSFILSEQVFDEVEDVKKEILFNKVEIFKKKYILSDEAKLLPLYLQNNLQVSLRVLEYLGFVNFDYSLPKLFARFEKFTSKITIDVGHNALAAQAIAKELKNEKKKFILIYNTFKDKDFDEVLKILKPFISEVQIIECEDKRIIEKSLLKDSIKSLGINVKDFDIIEMNNKSYYLVFGSFMVVENFLKGYEKYEKR